MDWCRGTFIVRDFCLYAQLLFYMTLESGSLSLTPTFIIEPRKHAGGMFLGRGRVPPNQDASSRMWIDLEIHSAKQTGRPTASLFYFTSGSSHEPTVSVAHSNSGTLHPHFVVLYSGHSWQKFHSRYPKQSTALYQDH